MKFTSAILGLLLASPSFAGTYDFISVPHSEVDQYMVRGTDENGTPESLQGLWWMNGNPLPDEVVSFAGAKWEDIVEDGVVTGHQATITVYDQGVWSWHDSFAGHALYTGALLTKLNYVARFNLDYTHAVVLPSVRVVPNAPELVLPPSMLLRFEFNQVSDDEYSRDSIILGQPTTYRFRRLVEADGTRTAAWDEFLAKVEAPNARLPVCRSNPERVLPTPCAQ